jgi:hypothetical protein
MHLLPKNCYLLLQKVFVKNWCPQQTFRNRSTLCIVGVEFDMPTGCDRLPRKLADLSGGISQLPRQPLGAIERP